MIYALITVFHPSEQVKNNINMIANQVDVTIICDNSPESNRVLFAPLIEAHNMHYLFFGENLGLSRAFNRALLDTQYGWQDNDYLFFFDQDSAIGEDHIETLISTYTRVREKCKVGCLGPVYFNTSSGRVEMPKKKRMISEKTYVVSSIITSSMLCCYGDLREIGFWNEAVFLDMADWDLCWRMQSLGKVCCLTDAAVLRHSVGMGEKKIGPFHLRVGAPIREYYQIRDCMYLLKKEYTPLKYRIRFLAMLLIRSPLHVFFLDHRKARMEYILRGVKDFYRGVHGEFMPEDEKVKYVSV